MIYSYKYIYIYLYIYIYRERERERERERKLKYYVNFHMCKAYIKFFLFFSLPEQYDNAGVEMSTQENVRNKTVLKDNKLSL